MGSGASKGHTLEPKKVGLHDKQHGGPVISSATPSGGWDQTSYGTSQPPEIQKPPIKTSASNKSSNLDWLPNHSQVGQSSPPVKQARQKRNKTQQNTNETFTQEEKAFTQGTRAEMDHLPALPSHQKRQGRLSPIQDYRETNEEERMKNASQKKAEKKKKKLKQENTALKTQVFEVKDEATAMNVQMEEYEAYIRQLEQENNELRTRLSQAVSDQLTENNPNIADLSDPNRPVKLGERFSELYNNQWSDAFDKLTDRGRQEREIVDLLLNIVRMLYDQCKTIADEGMECLRETVAGFTGYVTFPNHLKRSLVIYKDERRKNFKSFLPSLPVDQVISTYVEGSDITVVREYALLAAELCWLMCIQNPPLTMVAEISNGDVFDHGFFKEFTEVGDYYDFVIWPAILMGEDKLISKGIAQPIKRPKPIRRIKRDKPVTADPACAEDTSMHSNTTAEQKGNNSSLCENPNEVDHDLNQNDKTQFSSDYRRDVYECNNRKENTIKGAPSMDSVRLAQTVHPNVSKWSGSNSPRPRPKEKGKTFQGKNTPFLPSHTGGDVTDSNASLSTVSEDIQTGK